MICSKQTRLFLTLGVTIWLAAAVVATVASPPAQATPAVPYADDIQQAKRDIRKLRRSLKPQKRAIRQLQSKIRKIKQLHNAAEKDVSDRLVTLYTNGHTTGEKLVISSVADGGSVEEVLGGADMAKQVVKHSADRLEHFEEVKKVLPKMEDEHAQRKDRYIQTRKDIRYLKKKLRKLQRRQQQDIAARLREMQRLKDAALQMNRQTPPAPLVSPPVTPASVAQGTAQDLAQESGTSDIWRESGIASYYGDDFAGQTTASGETYDPQAMTAAHPSLPFGTVVTVTTNYGASVTVTINDRGPFVGGRIIDLSAGAAEMLGMGGTAHVTVTADMS